MARADTFELFRRMKPLRSRPATMPTIACGVTNTVRASAAEDARSRCINAWSTPNCDLVSPVWRNSRSSSRPTSRSANLTNHVIRPNDAEVRDPPERGLEHRDELRARQRRPDAAMLPDAEGDVTVGLAVGDEL